MRILVGLLVLSLTIACPAWAENASPEAPAAFEEDDAELDLEEEANEANSDSEEAKAATRAPSAQADKQYLRPKPSINPGELRPESKASDPTRVLLAFGVLVALGAGAAFMRRRRLPPELRDNTVQLAVISKLGLSPKAQVALVSVGGEAILLGVTEHGISTLRTFGPGELSALTARPEAAKAPAQEPTLGGREPSLAFQSLLEKASGKQAAPADVRLAKRAKEAEPDDDEVPEHLVRALDAAGLGGHGFDAPEGQAKQLAERFKGLRS
jgi:flagellar biogenesis protein FliO